MCALHKEGYSEKQLFMLNGVNICIEAYNPIDKIIYIIPFKSKADGFEFALRYTTIYANDISVSVNKAAENINELIESLKLDKWTGDGEKMLLAKPVKEDCFK